MSGSVSILNVGVLTILSVLVTYRMYLQHLRYLMDRQDEQALLTGHRFEPVPCLKCSGTGRNTKDQSRCYDCEGIGHILQHHIGRYGKEA